MSWFFGGGGARKYSRLPTDDVNICVPSEYAKKAFSFESAFTYDFKGTNSRNFKSVFKFDQVKNSMEADYYKYVEAETVKNSYNCSPLNLLSFLLTSLSYVALVLGFPILYWVCVVKLGDSDRMVVFRLGKMLGVKGPGTVIVFPWLDNFKRVDVRASAFSVPPQQFISADGGIIEMGSDIQFSIVDIETMVKEVADHQDILRSLGRSLMTKVLTKRTMSQLMKDRRVAADDILNLLNNQVRKWGIDIRLVSLSDPKVLQKPEAKSSLNPILQNLGLRQEKQFPSPQQFVQNHYRGDQGDGQDPNAEALNTLASAVGGFFTGEGPGLNLSSFNHPQQSSLPMASVGSLQPQGNITRPAPQSQPMQEPFWRTHLESIVNKDGLQLDPEAMGIYQININGTPAGLESYIIDVSPGYNRVKKTKECAHLKPNVQVTLEASDLMAVLQGTLSPLQAYLTGRISATGDVKKLMFFDKISSKGRNI